MLISSSIDRTFEKTSSHGLVVSSVPSKYKNGLIKTLFVRCYKINNTWKGFDNDLENLTKMLNKHQFPTKLINKAVSQNSI